MLGTDVKSGPFYSRPTVSKPARRLRSGPDGCETGQTALQLFISTTDGFKAVQTDEQLSWTVPKLCIKCTAARFSRENTRSTMRHAARFGYIFVKIHVVQCATLPYNSHMHGSLSLGQLGGKRSKPLESLGLHYFLLARTKQRSGHARMRTTN